METIASVVNQRLHHVHRPLPIEFASFDKSLQRFATSIYQFLFTHLNQFWIQLFYFISLSFAGFLVLRTIPTKNATFRPDDFDMFFMSASANTVSSMSTVEMEVFSNSQLVVLTLLMLLGGEVFTSMLSLQLMKIKSKKKEVSIIGDQDLILRYNSMRYLVYVVLTYLILVHVCGFTFILVYLSLVPSARGVIESKGIHGQTFSIFTTVSSFTNCGFIPTNENMLVFKTCSGLLLVIGPQILAGNTLFPPCLRSMIWVLMKLTKRREFEYILKNHGDQLGYDHLLPSLHSILLVLTVVGFVLVQFILFCCMEWRSEGLSGMNTYQKVVGAMFQSVNSRHAGESIVDISTISPAILVLYIVMMYLPPYTFFDPTKGGEPSRNREEGRKRKSLMDNLLLSQLSYLAIFTIIICITEREQLSKDPLNFNVLNIVIEVISAYGNVGFSTGYRCERRLKPDSSCKDAWYGFSGRWSNKGKLTLILVMFFGRLKKFSMTGGKAWKQS